ncbi:MAG: hypothetical protein JNL93_12270 [Pelomonas sp.]|nr:hypothetical protein [Roseateles sp.]
MFNTKPRRALALALGLEAALAGAAGAGGLPALPRQISLETDCNGCPTGTRIVLMADGVIQWQQLGKARLGTTDETRQGRVSPEDFAAVAELWQARGLGRMGEEFVDPQTQDGPWQLLRIEHADGTSQQVFRRGEAGPPALAEVIDAVTQTARKAGVDHPPR